MNVFEGYTSSSNADWKSTQTNIPQNTFKECSALTSFTIPSHITILKANAFTNSGLTRIEIPPNVKEIKSNVFSDCENLETVIYPHDGVTSDTTFSVKVD